MLNIIFDLDGTIINSSKEVLQCFDKAFKMANYEIDKSRLTPNVIGPPLRDIIINIANGEDDENIINDVTEKFHSIYDFDTNDISEFFPNMYELLTELKSIGKNLYMATYKPTRPTMRIAKQFGLNMFDEICTIDMFGEHITKTRMIEHIIKKYNLKKSETVMVGDAPSDMIAGKEAGIKTIGVLWGYGENKQPLSEQADILVKNTDELRQIVI